MNLIKAIGDYLRPNSTVAFAGSAYSSDPSVSSKSVDDQLIAETQISTTIFTCTDLISKAVANVDFNIEDKYWNDAFRDPNIMQSKYDFWYSVAWDALIFGNGYILRSSSKSKKKGSKGVLAPLDPVNVVPFGTLVAPKYRLKDDPKEYSTDEIIHIRHGGGSGLKAIGRIAAGWRRIQALESCDLEIENVFKNGISMSHILHGGSADNDALKKMLLSIKRSFGIGGKSRAGVVGITGGFKVETIKGVTPADSDLRDLRVDLIREIAALFGIPPFAAGGSSDTKFSNVVARHAQLAKDALLPLCINIASKLEHNLGSEVTFKEEDLLKGNFTTAIELAIKACGGPALTPNEARDRYLNLEEIDDGDKLRGKEPDPIPDDRSDENPDDGSNSDR